MAIDRAWRRLVLGLGLGVAVHELALTLGVGAWTARIACAIFGVLVLVALPYVRAMNPYAYDEDPADADLEARRKERHRRYDERRSAGQGS